MPRRTHEGVAGERSFLHGRYGAITLKALQLIGPENLVHRELPSRALGRLELRIKVEATCVCGSDLKNYCEPLVVPQVPGHEFSGEVLEAGTLCAAEFAPGARVTAFPMMSCMRCAQCATANHRDCAQKQSLGFHIPGSFAQEVIVDGRFAVRLSEGLSYEKGALVEHLACGYRVAKEIVAAAPSRETPVVIIGDGPIALADVQALRVLGYCDVTVVGKHPSRMRLARELGARRAVGAWERGEASIAICVYAAPSDLTLESILPDIRRGGIVFPQTRVKSAAALAAIEHSQIVLGRAFAYLLSDFSDVMRLIDDGYLWTKDLVTTRVRLHEVPEKVGGFFDKEKHFKIVITNT